METFTSEERDALAPYFTNLDGPVFALVNLPEVVKGALFARYSRYQGTLRRLFAAQGARIVEQVTIACWRDKSRVEQRCNLLSDLAIDREPTAHVAAKMSRGSARNEGRILPDALATSKPPGDYAQRAETGFRQLENRR